MVWECGQDVHRDTSQKMSYVFSSCIYCVPAERQGVACWSQHTPQTMDSHHTILCRKRAQISRFCERECDGSEVSLYVSCLLALSLFITHLSRLVIVSRIRGNCECNERIIYIYSCSYTCIYMLYTHTHSRVLARLAYSLASSVVLNSTVY